MNLLFICNEGRNRSKTAAELYFGEHNTMSAGLYTLMTIDLEKELNWADLIFVMEDHYEKTLRDYYPDMKKDIINLKIPDIYIKGEEK
jgi:predicted protein tyrosine phosphatase